MDLFRFFSEPAVEQDCSFQLLAGAVNADLVGHGAVDSVPGPLQEDVAIWGKDAESLQRPVLGG